MANPRAANGGSLSDWLFTSDLHGQTALYEQLLALVATRRPRALILGGDLAPHESGPAGVRRQAVFFDGFLVEFARRVREASRDTALALLMGNDDWAANEPRLADAPDGLWRYLHDRVIEIDGVPVAGTSWVPITPFGMKDWERWEDGGDESPPRLAGWRSGPEGLREFAFDPASKSPTIAEALEPLGRALERAPRAIVVSHGPPLGTQCDVVGSGTHVGSRALRRFVERHAPALVLSGHIHESPRVTNAFRDRIGDTAIVNPGQFGTSRLCAVWFDPRDAAGTLRHTVWG